MAAILAAATVESGWLMLVWNVLALLVLVCLSAAFSGSEATLFSLTPAQIQQHAASGSPLRRAAATLLKRPKRTLMTILVGNTAVNVLLFAASFVFFQGLAGQVGAWITPVSGVFSILLVVVCGEVLPKIVGVSHAERVSPAAALLVRTCDYVLGPIGEVLDRALVAPLTRLLLGPTAALRRSERSISTGELKTLLEMSRRRGVINATEDNFLREVIDLSHVRVRDVMVPRVEVQAFDVNGPPAGLLELMRRTRLKKVPVYDRVIDNLVGLVYAKVLFFNPGRALRELAVPVRFVPEMITCEQLLAHFRKSKSQIAIVVDEYGGMAGLVTLEDVLERIVGGIHDPYETPAAPEITEISEREYEISGQLSIHYWAESFGVPRFVERVATVGGLVTLRLGRPPKPGDRVVLGNVELEVQEVKFRRVERLRVRLLQAAEAVGC